MCEQPAEIHHKQARTAGSGGLGRISATQPLFVAHWGSDPQGGAALRRLEGPAGTRVTAEDVLRAAALEISAAEIPVMILPWPLAFLINKRAWSSVLIRIHWHSSLRQHRHRRPEGPLLGWPPADSEVWRPQRPASADADADAQAIPPLTGESLDKLARIVRSWGPSLLAQEPPPTTVEADMSFVLTTLDRWSFSWRQAMGMLNGPGGVSRFRHTSHKVLDCIRLSAHLTGGSSSLVDVVAQSLASVLPEFLREAFIKNVTKPSSNRRLLPSASLIRRYELAFDVALMLLSRKRASSVSSCIRVGWSDSSPLAGYDWIWSQYHEVDKSHLLATFRAISSLQ